MADDKYSAVWVSHTSISDFLTCPRAYYLRNVYKDPKTGNKVKLMTPPLALGQAVHEVIESLSVLPTDRRFSEPLHEKLDKAWEKVEGEKGGFFNKDVEAEYKRRGEKMLRRVTQNPGPLKNLAVKIQMELPHYWLSEEDGIILCGKIDWLEYNKESDKVTIIDFKTGKNKKDKESLQLPIYHLLVHNCQKREAEQASYWYIELDDEPTPQKLPDLEKSHTEILRIAKKVKLARQLEKFDCPKDGCWACKPMEDVVDGKAKHVGQDEYGADVYVMEVGESTQEETPEGLIL